MSDYFKHGTWNATCAVCGFVFKADQLQQRWDGVYVCSKDWEPRHPSDFARSRADTSQTVPWAQHDDSEETITVTALSGNTVNLSASLTNVHFFYTNTSASSVVTLPNPDHATFLDLSRVYVINNLEEYQGTDYTHTLTVSVAAGTLQGSNLVLAGTTARFRNVPAFNQWIREQ